jgi:hypothetical protein
MTARAGWSADRPPWRGNLRDRDRELLARLDDGSRTDPPSVESDAAASAGTPEHVKVLLEHLAFVEGESWGGIAVIVDSRAQVHSPDVLASGAARGESLADPRITRPWRSVFA